MSTLVVLFHDPDEDKAGELNRRLRDKNAYVDRQRRVADVEFPDGVLVVCYDDEPDEEVQGAIRQKVADMQPERKVLVVHDRTWHYEPVVREAQQSLTYSGGAMEGAEDPPGVYTHEEHDPLYAELLHLLSHSHLANVVRVATQQTLIRDFTHLKHRLGHIFSPIDIDLQGLIESGFNPDYMREIAESYQRKPGGAAGAGQSGGGTREPGEAVASLDAARQILYGGTPSVMKIKEQLVAAAGESVLERSVIENAWNTVEELLPPAADPPDGVRDILACMEADESIEQLKALLKPRNSYNNLFHRWYNALDESLDLLRRVLDEQAAKRARTREGQGTDAVASPGDSHP